MIEFIMFLYSKNKMCCTRLLLAINVFFFFPFLKISYLAWFIFKNKNKMCVTRNTEA